MTKIKLTGLEKVAILLRNLPSEVSDKVLKEMHPRHAMMIRKEVERIGNRSDLLEALSGVLDEANEVLDMTDGLGVESRSAGTVNGTTPEKRKQESTGLMVAPMPPDKDTQVGGRIDIKVEDPSDQPLRSEKSPMSVDSDPVRGLAAESPELLTAALENENARTISLLLNSMDVDSAGQVFKRLSAAKRKEVSICFTDQSSISSDLIGHIAQAVLDKCRELRATQQSSPGAGDPGGRDKRVAAMLRGLERAERMETLGVLEETDAELATRVKGMLYQFEDILRMDNPSVQKLLSDTDTKSLALAMSGAPKEIHEKLLKNLSKRAQESLKEEVELMGTVQAARAQQAKQSIVEAIQRLDQRGELVLIE